MAESRTDLGEQKLEPNTRLPQLTERGLHIAASVIAVLNFIFLGETIIQSNTPRIEVNYSIDNIFLSIIVFMILELALNSVFALFIVLVARYGEGVPFGTIILICCISAATSIFNVQWIIIGHIPSSIADWAGFILATLFACGLAIYFTHSVYNKEVNRLSKPDRKAYSERTAPFIKRAIVVQILIFILFLFIYAAS